MVVNGNMYLFHRFRQKKYLHVNHFLLPGTHFHEGLDRHIFFLNLSFFVICITAGFRLSAVRIRVSQNKNTRNAVPDAFIPFSY